MKCDDPRNAMKLKNWAVRIKMRPIRYAVAITALALPVFGSLSETRADTLNIGVENLQYFPHYATNEEGQITGYAADLFNRFSNDEGVEINIIFLSIDELYEQLFNREIDFKYPDDPFWLEERRYDLEIHYSDPVTAYVDGTLVRGAQPEIHTIATIKGFNPPPWSRAAHLGDVTLIAFETLGGAVEAALSGDADGVYANIDVVEALLDRKDEAGALSFEPFLPHAVGTYRVSSMTKPHMIQRLNAWMRARKAWLSERRKAYGIRSDF